MYTPQEIALAHEIANKLNDTKSLSFYLSCTKKYSHRILRDLLTHVASLPQTSIRTSRGALFNHLITTQQEEINDDESYD